MSRVGKKIRTIPQGVTVEIKDDLLTVVGPKGTLTQKIPARITVVADGNQLTVKVADETIKKNRALWGTLASLIGNMLEGVTVGFKKQLEINGVGFKVSQKGAGVSLEVGFSHSVEIQPPVGVKFSVEKNIITVEGADKQAVGEAAAGLRRVKKPEPYKGKGIKYVEEVLRRKAGKTATKAAA